MKILRSLLGICLLLHANLVFAASAFIVRAPELSLVEFRGIQRALPETVSLADRQAPNDRQEADSRQMTSLFAEAQKEYLGGSLDRAKQLYAQVAEHRFDYSWGPGLRRMFVFALLRMAQMADPTEESLHLQRAVEFDPTHDMDESVFPPPLVAAFNKVRGEVRGALIKWPPELKGYETVLINGRPVRLNPGAQLDLVGGTQRLDFLSSAFEAVVVMGGANEIKNLKLAPRAPLVSGNCGAPALHPSLSTLGRVTVVYPDSCVRVRVKGVWQTDDSTKNLQGLDLRVTDSESPNSVPIIRDAPEPGTQKWYHNKWVWIGAGTVTAAIVTAVLISQNRRANGGGGTTIVEQPVHR